jgi:hypothetical protein
VEATAVVVEAVVAPPGLEVVCWLRLRRIRFCVAHGSEMWIKATKARAMQLLSPPLAIKGKQRQITGLVVVLAFALMGGWQTFHE